MGFTFLLPGIAQAYWLWELWPATATLSHPLALLAIWILAQMVLVGWRAPHSLRHHRVQMKPLPKLKRP
jgi:energy-converting hydrogenase Eha subunit F